MFGLRWFALLPWMLLGTATAAHAAAIVSVTHWSELVPPTIATNEAPVTASISRNFNHSTAPGYGFVQAQVSTGASARGLDGYVGAGTGMYAYQGAFGGLIGEAASASASLTDVLHWSGLTPLTVSFDLDWSALSGHVDNGGEPLLAGVATALLNYSVWLRSENNAIEARRTFSASRINFSDNLPDEEVYRLLNTAGQAIALGDPDDLAGHFLASFTLDPVGYAVDLLLTNTLLAQIECHSSSTETHERVCQAAALANNSGYLSVDGDFVSANGYRYLGRIAEPPVAVPAPPTLALSLLGLAGVLGFRRRAKA